jgi:hypothetical protein
MRRTLIILALAALSACTPAGSRDDPRDRTGAAGVLTWRLVAQDGGQAAFLSRPGAAPDLVLWCRDTGMLTLRAHIFEAPSAQPDLLMTTKGGSIAFTNVRRQGGVRAGDRKLVEGSVMLTDATLPAVLNGAGNLTVTSGGMVYSAKQADPTGILPPFSAACTGNTQPTKARS